MKRIELPNKDLLEFPDEMDDAAIEKAIHLEYPEYAPQPTAFQRARQALSAPFKSEPNPKLVSEGQIRTTPPTFDYGEPGQRPIGAIPKTSIDFTPEGVEDVYTRATTKSLVDLMPETRPVQQPAPIPTRQAARELQFAPTERALSESALTQQQYNPQPNVSGVERYARDFAAGELGSTAALFDYLGVKTGWKPLSNLGQNMGGYAERITPRDQQFADRLASGVGSFASFYLPGLGVAKSVGLLKAMPILAQQGMGALTMAALESAMEAGDVYDQLKKTRPDIPEQEVQSRMDAVFWQNLPVIMATDKIAFFNNIAGPLVKALNAAGVNAAQEAYQAGISNIALEQPITTGMGESAVIGGIIGGGAGGVQGMVEQPSFTRQELSQVAKGEQREPDIRTILPQVSTSSTQEGAGIARGRGTDSLSGRDTSAIAERAGIGGDIQQISPAPDGGVGVYVQPQAQPEELTPEFTRAELAGIVAPTEPQVERRQEPVAKRIPYEELAEAYGTTVDRSGEQQRQAEALLPKTPEQVEAKLDEQMLERAKPKGEEHAVQIGSTEKILQREQGRVGIEGRERGRMEPEIQRQEVTPTQEGRAPVEQVQGLTRVVNIDDLQLNEEGIAIARAKRTWEPTYRHENVLPIKAVRLDNGKLYVLDGYHRIEQAMRDGKKRISVDEVPMTDELRNRIVAENAVKTQPDLRNLVETLIKRKTPAASTLGKKLNLQPAITRAKELMAGTRSMTPAELSWWNRTARTYEQADVPAAEAARAIAAIVKAGKIAPTVAEQAETKYAIKQTETPEFKKWFGDSKVVDKTGKPRIVYRGEAGGNQFEEFDLRKTNAGIGFFFAEARAEAEGYAKNKSDVRSFYLQAKNVLDLTDPYSSKNREFIKNYIEEFDEWTDRYSGEDFDVFSALEAGTIYDYEGTGSGRRWNRLFTLAESMGYDAVRVTDATDGIVAPVWVVFKPTQIKSTDNIGTFDETKPSILEQKSQDYLVGERVAPKNVKVTKNIYGNFRGFETGKPSVELGANEFDAKLWLAEKLQNPIYKVMPTSYFSAAEAARAIAAIVKAGKIVPTVAEQAETKYEVDNIVEKYNGFNIVFNKNQSMPYSIANTDNIYAKYYLTLSSAKSAIDRGLVSLTKPSRDYLVGDRTVTELKQEIELENVHAATTLSVLPTEENKAVYAVTAELVKVGEKQMPPVVKTIEDAAKAFAYLQRYAVEHYDALVTDKDGKPLGVIGSFKGAINQTAVYPTTVLLELGQIQNAAHLWAAHNHPSGEAILSKADMQLNETFTKLLQDSGVSYEGLFALARRKNEAQFAFEKANLYKDLRKTDDELRKGHDYSVVMLNEKIDTVPVNVSERMIDGDPAGVAIISAPVASSVVPVIAKDVPSIITLSNSLVPTGLIPIDPNKLEVLRTEGRLMKLLNAIGKTTPNAVIIANPNNKISKVAVNNVAAMFRQLDIPLRDAVSYNYSNGVATNQISAAERGELNPLPLFFSRSFTDEATFEAQRRHMTNKDAVLAEIKKEFPSWTKYIDKLLERGEKGQRGGLVIGTAAENMERLSALLDKVGTQQYSLYPLQRDQEEADPESAGVQIERFIKKYNYTREEALRDYYKGERIDSHGNKYNWYYGYGFGAKFSKATMAVDVPREQAKNVRMTVDPISGRKFIQGFKYAEVEVGEQEDKRETQITRLMKKHSYSRQEALQDFAKGMRINDKGIDWINKAFAARGAVPTTLARAWYSVPQFSLNDKVYTANTPEGRALSLVVSNGVEFAVDVAKRGLKGTEKATIYAGHAQAYWQKMLDTAIAAEEGEVKQLENKPTIELQFSKAPTFYSQLERAVEKYDRIQPSFVITPELKAKVLSEGLPLFSQKEVVRGAYSPELGIAFVNTDTLSSKEAVAVILHEMTHAADTNAKMRELGEEVIRRINKHGGIPTYNRVAERMSQAGEEGNPREALNYLIEEVLQDAKKFGYSRLDSGFMGWLQRARFIHLSIKQIFKKWLAAIRAAMFKHGIILEAKDMYVDDMIAVAVSGMKEIATGKREAAKSVKAKATLNIGMDVSDGTSLSVEEIRKAVRATGAEIVSDKRHVSDTELTLVIELSRPLTKAEAFSVSKTLRQEAIAQYADGKGFLAGPQAEKWGEFNPEFFIMPSGKRAEKIIQPVKKEPRGKRSETAIVPSYKKVGTDIIATDVKSGTVFWDYHIEDFDGSKVVFIYGATKGTSPIDVLNETFAVASEPQLKHVGVTWANGRDTEKLLLNNEGVELEGREFFDKKLPSAAKELGSNVIGTSLRNPFVKAQLQRFEAIAMKNDITLGSMYRQANVKPRPAKLRAKAFSDIINEGKGEEFLVGFTAKLPEKSTVKVGRVPTVKGVHFSTEQRDRLLGRMFGTGIKGAERTRVAETKDNRLKSRIAFYVDEGQGVFPEAGVGKYRHEVSLDNLYDAAVNPLKLPAKDFNEFESAVLDAGFDGYYVKEAFGRQGAAVLLGEAAKEVKVEPKIQKSSYALAGIKIDDVTLNPSAAKLLALLRKTEYKELRGLFDADGNLHVWDAELATHKDGAEVVGIPYDYRNRVVISEVDGLPAFSWKDIGVTRSALSRYFNSDSVLIPMGGRGYITTAEYARETANKDDELLGKLQFSKKIITGDTGRTRTPEQIKAFENVGRAVEVPTVKERTGKLWHLLCKNMAQGLADQFAPIEDIDHEAYRLLRQSKGASGAFAALLEGGQLKLVDQTYAFDSSKKGGVIDRLLVPLQGEADDFLWWIAANRAERLMAQTKEHLFSPQDIAAMKSLANGKTKFEYTLQHGATKGSKTYIRSEIYADALKTFNEFNKNTLDMAEQSGLIDPTSRKIWEYEFYVPFYRVSDEDTGSIRGVNVKSGVVRQQAFKQLRGGTEKLNTDLLENILLNWSHLLDAAAKNRAAKSALEAAEKVGVAHEVSAPEKNTVWFMDNGSKRHFVVDDPAVMTAITALEFAGMRGGIMNSLSTFKHYLTIGVTASPFFKIRNLIRDSMQSIAISKISYNLPKNVAKGFKGTKFGTDAYFNLLASGSMIHFGTMLENRESDRVRALVEKGVDRSTILDNEGNVRKFYKRVVEPFITAYNELGDRSEAINRSALYEQLVKQGVPHGEAALQARDLLDFSMSGAWTTVRFLTQTVPFFNARIQGLYKLGKAAKQDPQRMAIVLGATALFSVMLMLMYKDDEDWKKREDWDRDNYWWFKIGGIAYRIPKPFEIGAIASLAERGVELRVSDEMTGERFAERTYRLLMDNLSMNPTIQAVKPIVDVYANEDSFTGRKIESQGMEAIESEYRYRADTSMLARGAAKVTPLSPVQIDHLIRGYFGWLGSFVVQAGDVIARPVTGQPVAPAIDPFKKATGGLVAQLEGAPSRYVTQMYEQAKKAEQAYATYRMLIKKGQPEEAAKYAEENLEQISKARAFGKTKGVIGKLNNQIRLIEQDTKMTAQEKRQAILELNKRKEVVAKRMMVAAKK